VYPVLILALSASIAAIITAVATLISKSYPEGCEEQYKKYTKRILWSGIGMLIVSGLFLLLKMY